MKSKIKKSITEIDGNIIPFPSKNQFSNYDNKLLKDYDCDDFASLIIDACDCTGQLANCRQNPLLDDYDIPYLKCIPKEFSRVYLYGVWMVLKGHINSNINKNCNN